MTTKMASAVATSYIIGTYSGAPSYLDIRIFNSVYLFSFECDRFVLPQKYRVASQCVAVFICRWHSKGIANANPLRSISFHSVQFSSVQLHSARNHLNWLQIYKNKWRCFYVIASKFVTLSIYLSNSRHSVLGARCSSVPVCVWRKVFVDFIFTLYSRSDDVT